MLGKGKILKHCKHGNDLILDTHDVLIGKIFIIFFNGNKYKELLRYTTKNIKKMFKIFKIFKRVSIF